jgi:hypothetical protein
MRAELTKASCLDFKEFREVATLDDLLAIMEEFCAELIVGRAGSAQDHEIQITIYDYYVE